MMAIKERLSVSVAPELVAAGREAVAAGRSESLSAWVSAALVRQAEDEALLARADVFFAEYEAEHGVITEQEQDAAHRSLQDGAIVVDDGAVTSDPFGLLQSPE